MRGDPEAGTRLACFKKEGEEMELQQSEPRRKVTVEELTEVVRGQITKDFGGHGRDFGFVF